MDKPTFETLLSDTRAFMRAAQEFNKLRLAFIAKYSGLTEEMAAGATAAQKAEFEKVTAGIDDFIAGIS